MCAGVGEEKTVGVAKFKQVTKSMFLVQLCFHTSFIFMINIWVFLDALHVSGGGILLAILLQPHSRGTSIHQPIHPSFSPTIIPNHGHMGREASASQHSITQRAPNQQNNHVFGLITVLSTLP